MIANGIGPGMTGLLVTAVAVTLATFVALRSDRFANRGASAFVLAGGLLPWMSIMGGLRLHPLLFALCHLGCAPAFLAALCLFRRKNSHPTAVGACCWGILAGTAFTVEFVGLLGKME